MGQKLRISSSPDPGVGGAIKDAMKAVFPSLNPDRPRQRRFGPKGQTEHDMETDDANTPSNAGMQAQSSDASNGY
jgi:hypothetical protein